MFILALSFWLSRQLPVFSCRTVVTGCPAPNRWIWPWSRCCPTAPESPQVGRFVCRRWMYLFVPRSGLVFKKYIGFWVYFNPSTARYAWKQMADWILLLYTVHLLFCHLFDFHSPVSIYFSSPFLFWFNSSMTYR